jgi:hypothetical protein
MSLNSHASGTPSPTDATTIMQSISNYQRKSGNVFYYSNGSSIAAYSGDVVDLVIDWNADQGANLSGDDQIHYYFNDCNGSWAGILPGRFGVTAGSNDETLYLEVFR